MKWYSSRLTQWALLVFLFPSIPSFSQSYHGSQLLASIKSSSAKSAADTKNSLRKRDINQTSLNQVLNADGTLIEGIEGTFDATGFTLNYGENEEPVFRVNRVSASTPFAGLYGDVHAIAISGTNVYVAGGFTNAGGNANADCLAVWNGSTWNALGTGLNNSVNAIAISGTNVYAAGLFTNAGGDVNADFLAVWNGSTWNALGTGMPISDVYTIAVSGDNVYVGGFFTDAVGNVNADYIAVWNGSVWNALGTGLNSSVNAIAVSGENVYVGGFFIDAGGNVNADHVAVWNGSVWSALGTGLNNGVISIAVSGSNIYVGGSFTDAGGNANADKIAVWNGSVWSALGTGFNDTVYAIAVSGTNVYVGGSFTEAGGNVSVDYIDHIAVWNGSSWNSLAEGLNNVVETIVVSGANIFAGGRFNVVAGDDDANYIAFWDGSTWNPIPPPTITSFNPTDGISGTSVVITGTNFNATPENNILKFNGTVATVVASTATSITTTVPPGATTGRITVTADSQTGTSIDDFTVPPTTSSPPMITSFTPMSGAIGTLVTITGTNFNQTAADNIVYFGATKAVVTTATATVLSVTVPAGATYQPISVLTRGLIGFSKSPFIVTFPGTPGIDINSFADGTTFTSGVAPRDILLADFDVDGKADMVVLNSNTNSLSILRSTTTEIGSPSFAEKVDLSIGNSSYAFSMADFDGDGKIDLVATEQSLNKIWIFRNTSQGAGYINFDAKVGITTQSPTFITVSDFDLDGKIDIVSRSSQSISIFRNLSAGPSSISFSPSVDFSIDGIQSITAGDVDGDGKPDLITTNTLSSSISILRNLSLGTGFISFAPKTDFGVGSKPYSVAVGDLDNDGKADLAVVNYESNTLSLLRSTSTGIGSISYAAKTDLNTEIYGFVVSIGDLDGDRKPDLVVNSYSLGKASVFRNVSETGSINFNTRVNFNIGFGVASVAIGDIDGDGKGDLSGGSGNNNVVVLKNKIVGIPMPAITDFTPVSGTTGASVTIIGTNFSTTPANNIVKFNGTAATVTTSTATSMTTIVPANATSGKISVIVSGQTAESASAFTIASLSSLVQIANSVLPTSYDKGLSLTVSITVNDATKVSTVILKSRGISEPFAALKNTNVMSSGNKYEIVIPGADLVDPIGLIYYFEVTDNASGSIQSATSKAFVKYPVTDQIIPNLTFGDQVSNYQIIAIPLELTDKNVTSVFSALGAYDKKLWRLFDYSTGDNREYPAFSTIATGKGYWLIARDTKTISPGEGTAVTTDDVAPYSINLAAGWNLIGNPYNFRISWDDVLAANSGITGVGAKLKVFSSGTLSDGVLMDRYRGAFLFADNAVTIKIPAIRNTILGGRTAQSEEVTHALDQPHWEVKLKLKNGALSNELGGIGMNPRAKLRGKDDFDEVSVPLPDGLGLFEAAFPHPEFFTNFNKEVVPTQENFMFEFSVKRSDESTLDLSWSNYYFGDNEKQLILVDPLTLLVTDMRKENHVPLAPVTKKLTIIFGDDAYIQEKLDSQLPWLGSPYPNPAREELTIPFRVPESLTEAPVLIKIYNSSGAEVATPINSVMTKGSYNVKWQPVNESGLYLIRMKIGGQETQSLKVIIK